MRVYQYWYDFALPWPALWSKEYECANSWASRLVQAGLVSWVCWARGEALGLQLDTP